MAVEVTDAADEHPRSPVMENFHLHEVYTFIVSRSKSSGTIAMVFFTAV
jgi:hypothetical protein